MADRPRFSIAVPAYNAQATLAETIASVKAQTFPDWELIIVDDGSTDETRDVAERLARGDARIRAICQENRGSGGACNTAVHNARGDLLVMLSADDLLLPEHLATFDGCVRGDPAASVFTSGGWYEYEDGRREAARPQARWSDAASCTLEELLSACFYGVGAVYRRAVFDTVGGFREDIYAEDYLFWLLALAHGFKHRHVNRPLSVHRRSYAQKSANAILMRETDLRVITELMGTTLLSDSQLAAARRSAARLKRNIQSRRILERTIGPTALERLTARVRSARAGALARSAPASGDLAVTFINNFPGPSLGGGEVQLLALLRGLSAAGVRASVACAAGSALERDARAIGGVEVIPAGFALRSLPSLVSKTAVRLQRGQIIQGTGYLTNLIARLVGSLARVPVVNTVHVVPGAARLDGEAPAVSALRMALDRLTRRSVTRFVAVSQAVSAGLIGEEVGASRITVIPNGIDLAQLRRDADSDLAITLRPASARVGFVGRLERIKGAEYFVRAAALLIADRPDVHFVVAGQGSGDGNLRELAAQLGIAARIEFLGYVGSVPPLLAALDVVVVPSLSEASGLTAIEALALGVPVVASRVGGLPEVVVDGVTGLLVAPGDEAALARAVARLLDDPALARSLAEAGAQRVEERFALERMLDGYLRLYRELVS